MISSQSFVSHPVLFYTYSSAIVFLFFLKCSSSSLSPSLSLCLPANQSVPTCQFVSPASVHLMNCPCACHDLPIILCLPASCLVVLSQPCSHRPSSRAWSPFLLLPVYPTFVSAPVQQSDYVVLQGQLIMYSHTHSFVPILPECLTCKVRFYHSSRQVTSSGFTLRDVLL